MYVLSVDPGDTTGMFLKVVGVDRVMPSYWQETGWSAMTVATDLMDSYPIQIVIIERFNLRDPRPKANAQWALDVIGALRWECERRGIQVVMQWNRDKNQVSDKKLEELGILIKPKTKWRHANDAARHYVFWSVLNGKGKK